MSRRTISVSLSPELAKFVRMKVASGLYASASEVVGEALRSFAERTSGASDVPTLLDLQEQEIDRGQARTAIQRLRRLRKSTTLGPNLTVENLRDAGRR